MSAQVNTHERCSAAFVVVDKEGAVGFEPDRLPRHEAELERPVLWQ